MRWRTLLAVFSVGQACGGDPRLTESRVALHAWEEAESTTVPEVRRAALERALVADPASLALRRALARLLASEGDVGGAEALLTAAIPPALVGAHAPVLWDRAAIRAGAGDLEGAEKDLRACVDLGVDPRALGADPAFSMMSGRSEYGELLPQPVLQAQEAAPARKVLVGETWRRTIRVLSPPGALQLVPVGPMPTDLVLASVVEDVIAEDAYTVVREIRFEWQTTEPGLLDVPALQVGVGPLSSALPPQALEVVAVGGQRQQSAAKPLVSPSFPVPSTHDATLEDGAVVDLPGGHIVQAPAHWSCRLAPKATGAVRMVRRAAGQPRWSGWWVPLGVEVSWTCPEQGVSANLR